jgi:hypothetical protein
MIGNPNWFYIRKYTGWGLTPKTWQGWVYILAFVIPIALVNSLGVDQNFKNLLTIIIAGILLVDSLHVMTKIKQDERERLHEAIANQSALWFMIFALIVAALSKQSLDPTVVFVIVGAMLVKAATHFFLRDK